MEKLNRWIAKHYWLSIVLFFLIPFIALLAIAQVCNDWVTLWCCVAGYVWIFWGARWLPARGNALMKKPMEILVKECDPYPYLEEAKKQRDFQGNRNMKFTYIYNEISALKEVGELEQADQLLMSVPEGSVAQMAPLIQAMYFSERVYHSIRLKNADKMEFWYKKLVDVNSRTKRKTHKQFVASLLISARVHYHRARKEYAQSLQYLQLIPQRNLRERVVVAWNRASIHLAEGEREAAKDKLEFVVQNGNKLYIVTEAKKLLESINMEETIQ